MQSDLEQITNYMAVLDWLLSAGQPTREQFTMLRAAGCQVVINLALPTSTNAIPEEEDVVRAAGMDYVHIPVVWEDPRPENLDRFFEALENARAGLLEGNKVLVHCALNMRASAFVYLFRVLRLGADPEDVCWDMLSIWEPNPLWQGFIDQALADRR